MVRTASLGALPYGLGLAHTHFLSYNPQNLDYWISFYGTTVTPRWGWANGINLAERS